MKAKLIVFMLIFFHHLNHALIIESNRLATVLDYISSLNNTLVIFDIDNTLAHPAKELGSDEWFCHHLEQKKAEGFDWLTAVYYTLPILYYAQFHIDLVPTESGIPELIEYLIKNNIAVMALSTRSLPIAERTAEQLDNINIYFFIPDINPNDLVLPMKYPCFYKDGILFSGDNDKGETLSYFFDIMDYHPELVIFIDDKMKHLLSVEKALQNHQIQFVGIRYSGCDEQVKNFNPTKSDAQWKALRRQQNRKYIN